MVERPLKIDLHTHVLPPELPDFSGRFGADGFVRLERVDPCTARMMRGETQFREISSNCWDLERRLAECDAYGVDVQVLSTVPVLFSYWAEPADALELARFLNDHIASAVARYPSRFVGLGTLPLQAPELAVRELERCHGELGLAGVEIGTHVSGENLDAAELYAVFERAAEIGAAVFVHPWDMLGAERMRRHWLPWLVGMPTETSLAICSLVFGGVLDRLPALRIGFAHGGGAFVPGVGRIAAGHAARPDLCSTPTGASPRDYLRRLYVDSLVHDPLLLALLVRQMGADRIALGSDYPFPLGEAEPGRAIESLSGLTDPERARMLGGTALEFLALDAARFAR